MENKIKLEKSLFQKSYLYFIVFFILMLWAFWTTYFTKLFHQENYRMHLHGVTLILWCLMLIVQPYLIRAKKVNIHRKIGKLSYLLVPLILLTSLDLLKYRLSQTTALTNTNFYAVALVLNALVIFVILYGLAIYNRRKGAIHARYMLCTAFPMFTPITDRIIFIYFPSWLNYVPNIGGEPVAPVFGFTLADILLIGLSIWDWRSHKRWNVFPFALLLLIGYHFSVLNFYKYPFWIKFCEWFSAT
ncbi:hypothetical protein KJS94_02760 [Flavihumibacter rivuli]|uniref:hypothetical protein n=1 Tax=Flavihumibacter rivuli TaxID=2838156 RepID=UPI001BDF5C62|nr:hypothetical protein [Flavihumibacter rivuli]ULQ57117.1 hypothetical protein KJS94_02760 [Flavihumibacter rivuli]